MTDAPTVEIEGSWPDDQAVLSLSREWLDPCRILPPNVLDAALWEQSAVTKIAEEALNKRLFVVPSLDPDFSSRTAAADLALNSFTIKFGSGLNARIGLILRLLFDRREKGDHILSVASQRSERAALLSRDTSRKTIHHRYADLLGTRVGPPAKQLSWWVDNIPLEAEESYETRNGFRFGHLFIFFHELSHIALGHFEGEEAASVRLASADRTLLRLGYESQADLFALFNLIVYIDCCVEAEAASEFGPPEEERSEERQRERNLYVIAARGGEMRAAMLGIFAVMSCFSPMLWTNLDFRDEEYFQATTRLGLAVKLLDHLGIPTDGAATFSCFDWMPLDGTGMVGVLGTKPRWNWSDFFSAAIYEWDVEVMRFLNDMRERHELPIASIPFAIHRSGLDYSRETFERYRAATELAERFQTGDGLFMSSAAFARHF